MWERGGSRERKGGLLVVTFGLLKRSSLGNDQMAVEDLDLIFFM